MFAYARSSIPIGMAAASLLFAATPAAAQVAQANKLLVQARVGELCTVTSATLDFGQSIDTTVDTNAEGSIEITCQSETTLQVGLEGGHPRFMTLAGTQAAIEYELFQDSARTNLWNSATPVSATIASSGSIPVYGRVPVQADSDPPGLYTDEVTITLIF